MPDTTTVVKTLDIQMLDADRQDATLIKLDNPKDNITREMVSAAMQPAFANNWFLTTKGFLSGFSETSSVPFLLVSKARVDFPQPLTPQKAGNP